MSINFTKLSQVAAQLDEQGKYEEADQISELMKLAQNSEKSRLPQYSIALQLLDTAVAAVGNFANLPGVERARLSPEIQSQAKLAYDQLVKSYQAYPNQGQLEIFNSYLKEKIIAPMAPFARADSKNSVFFRGVSEAELATIQAAVQGLQKISNDIVAMQANAQPQTPANGTPANGTPANETLTDKNSLETRYLGYGVSAVQRVGLARGRAELLNHLQRSKQSPAFQQKVMQMFDEWAGKQKGLKAK